jgi:hypothetical protein
MFMLNRRLDRPRNNNKTQNKENRIEKSNNHGIRSSFHSAAMEVSPNLPSLRDAYLSGASFSRVRFLTFVLPTHKVNEETVMDILLDSREKSFQ